ncbi:MAG TPA: Mur ligase family protein [Bacteroidales bacterium]|nr:Mur ligase family protein [Bacteroidales bacterium]
MNYYETLEFLFSQLPAYHRIGKAAYRNNLDNTNLLDKHFGYPHQKFRSVHVAGTNGKGSVSNLLASILQEAGYRTGLYTSPHLIDFRERIRVDGKMIPEEDVVAFVEANRAIIEEIKPSFFEMTVAMAFDHFAKQEVDVAVIEVGLGGRLDSTNIITPLLSVITNIGHDHMDLLGDTLEKVAEEKAGIIKQGIPIIIGETNSLTAPVFRGKAADSGSEILFADQIFRCDFADFEPASNGRRYIITDNLHHEVIKGVSALSGDYQQKNLVTIAAAVSNLRKNFLITDKNLIDGISRVAQNTGFSGRWQVLSAQPLIICDTGHNKEGLEYVMSQLQCARFRELHIIMGFVNDKDISSILPLFPVNAKYYFTKASVNRALNESILRERAEAYSLKGECYSNVSEAIISACRNASDEDLIFIGGSTFVVGDAMNYFEKRAGSIM